MSGAHTVERGSGSVVNVASIAGPGGTPVPAHYAVTKAAVISPTRTPAAERAPAGVRVNALTPGRVRTDLTTKFFADPGASAGLPAAVPSGVLGDPSDLVGSVAHLVGDASRGVTGSCPVSDGGATSFIGGPQMPDFLQQGSHPRLSPPRIPPEDPLGSDRPVPLFPVPARAPGVCSGRPGSPVVKSTPLRRGSTRHRRRRPCSTVSRVRCAWTPAPRRG
ncbi:SDR family NAD(P)-dependent oxidoreductase [Actinosynnema sp. NPDC053489]|uniref:SDR family NAD(P)-dependent oxidoreductase n=1 Tax=Actinosynnema sp. NPDC053489 TaxID=3363916 RepID=UPI0037CC6512